MSKTKWKKRFKYFAKQAGVKRSEISFWSEYVWRENIGGSCSVLSAKDAAFELSHWMNK